MSARGIAEIIARRQLPHEREIAAIGFKTPRFEAARAEEYMLYCGFLPRAGDAPGAPTGDATRRRRRRHFARAEVDGRFMIAIARQAFKMGWI